MLPMAVLMTPAGDPSVPAAGAPLSFRLKVLTSSELPPAFSVAPILRLMVAACEALERAARLAAVPKILVEGTVGSAIEVLTLETGGALPYRASRSRLRLT
jgi:hypothetical protein